MFLTGTNSYRLKIIVMIISNWRLLLLSPSITVGLSSRPLPMLHNQIGFFMNKIHTVLGWAKYIKSKQRIILNYLPIYKKATKNKIAKARKSQLRPYIMLSKQFWFTFHKIPLPRHVNRSTLAKIEFKWEKITTTGLLETLFKSILVMFFFGPISVNCHAFKPY